MFHEVDADSASRTRVKICGITNAADALAAFHCGADAIGLNFFRGSRRFLDLDGAREWVAELPNELAKIAVLVNPTPIEAVEMAGLPFISGLQLHGQETSDFCRLLAGQGIRFAKALPVSDGRSLAELPSFFTRTVVLDSQADGSFGGSGRSFSWEIAAKFVSEHPEFRVVLAGGLTPENVAKAVEIARPFAVDVTTGVESSAGRKDHGRLRAFIDAARAA